MRQWAIDTNVVVSGLLVPQGPSAKVLDAVLTGRVKLVHDARILAEYRDVLHRPRLKLAPDKVRAFLAALEGQLRLTPARLRVVAPDADDLLFIEAALATPDRTIVTGNLAHYPADILHGARVLTPVQANAELARD
jgi:putative PIN family toxin of toxin-antitoxin system